MRTVDPSTQSGETFTSAADHDAPIRILAISGSLRSASSNSAALDAAALLAPANVHVLRYRGLADLPHFNPDLETGPLPAGVADLRRQVGLCNGLLIASPEYAHGIAGALKNALDWLVGSIQFPGKPVALINTSPRASVAYDQLREVLRTMSAEIVDAACISLPLTGRALEAAGIASDAYLAATLHRCLRCLSDAAHASRRSDQVLPPIDSGLRPVTSDRP